MFWEIRRESPASFGATEPLREPPKAQIREQYYAGERGSATRAGPREGLARRKSDLDPARGLGSAGAGAGVDLGDAHRPGAAGRRLTGIPRAAVAPSRGESRLPLEQDYFCSSPSPPEPAPKICSISASIAAWRRRSSSRTNLAKVPESRTMRGVMKMSRL